MDGLLDRSAAERRFALVLFEVFGVAALVLAAVGIYGLLSGSVTERTREMGVRLALGATRRDVLSLVMRQGMTLAGLGVVVLLAAVSAVACWVPAWRASRIDPSITLRAE